jgi:NitT/TauT family transport system substrate-binding protein
MKTKLSRLIFLVLLVVVAVGFISVYSGCHSKRSFAIGFNQWVGFAPFFLAKEKGYFGDLDVSLNFIDVEGDKRAGLESGRLQMICETMDMFQSNRDSSNYSGTIIFAIDESHGGDGVIASEEVKTLQNLKGKTVAAEPGQPAHFVLQFLLHKEGMSLSDLRFTDMTSSDAAAAFIAARADAAGTYEPYLSQALTKRAGSHLLVSTKDLPGLIVDVAIVTDPTLETRAEDLKRVYAGWCRAVNDINTDPQGSAEIMAKSFKISAKEFDETRSGLRYFGTEENNALIGVNEKKGTLSAKFSEISKVLIENRITRVAAPPESKISNAIVNAAE